MKEEDRITVGVFKRCLQMYRGSNKNRAFYKEIKSLVERLERQLIVQLQPIDSIYYGEKHNFIMKLLGRAYFRHEAGGFTFALEEGNNVILVFKGNALADIHCCKDHEEALKMWREIKKRKKVIWKK